MSYLLQRVVFPTEHDPDLTRLYFDAEVWTTIDAKPVRLSENNRLDWITGRGSLRVPVEQRVSFGSYFNAFPASYWQHWTKVSAVTLKVTVRGTGTLLVYRSNGNATQQREFSQAFSGEQTLEVVVPLAHFSDGGWIWFDLDADATPVELVEAGWYASEAPVREGNATIGITTFNKPEYCVATLSALAAEPDTLAVIDQVVVVDQGTQLVADQTGFSSAKTSLGDKLRVVQQANLGGSGGFARAMLETLEAGQSSFVQLLDDDVTIEPESIRRSVVFGRYTTEPTIVGAHMFDLLDRTRLHAWAEVVDDRPFMWRNLYQDDFPHDFGASNLRQSPILHRRLDADYNGWWMCLIPVSIIREIGLPLPFFIKWDDAEYALRARERGHHTVSLPGVALWHVSWVGKDDLIDWQAYFHARNRIVAGLIHSQSRRGGTLIRHSRRVDIKHLMLMQYYPVELRLQAIAAVLSGPNHLWPDLPVAMPSARAASKEFAETVLRRERDGLLRSRHGRVTFPVATEQEMFRQQPSGLWLRWFTATTLLKNWLRSVPQSDLEIPQAEYSKFDARWWRVPQHNSVIVSAASGEGKLIYVRNRSTFRALNRRSVRLHRRLQRRWGKLSADYRAAAPDLTSPESWKRVFDA